MIKKFKVSSIALITAMSFLLTPASSMCTVKANPDSSETENVYGLTEDDADREWLEENSTIIELGNTVSRYSRTGSNLPDSFDNSDTKYFPEVISQLGGSCTTYSSVYYTFTYTMNKLLDRDGSTKETSYSPIWVYNYLNNGSSEQGTSYADCFSILKEIGTVTNDKVFITDGDTSSLEDRYFKNWHSQESLEKEALSNKIDEVYTLKIDSDHTIASPEDTIITSIKQQISEGNLLCFATYINGWEMSEIAVDPDDSESTSHAGEKICKWYNANNQGAHAMTIVGYDDHIWTDINEDGVVQEGEKGALKIVNSWGKDYANEGFCWVSYDALNSISSVVNETIQDEPRGAVFRHNELYTFTVKDPNAENHIYAAIKINTSDRSAIDLSIQPYKNYGYADTLEEEVFEPFVFSSINSGRYSLNGYDAATDGMYIIDLNNCRPEQNEFVDTDEAPDPNVAYLKDLDVKISSETEEDHTNLFRIRATITNNGDTALVLGYMEFRYYLTSYSSNSKVYYAQTESATLVEQNKDISGSTLAGLKFMEESVPKADSYASIFFYSSAGYMNPGETLDFTFYVTNTQGRSFYQSENYSYDETATGLTTNKNVTVYYNERLAYGNPPTN